MYKFCTTFGDVTIYSHKSLRVSPILGTVLEQKTRTEDSKTLMNFEIGISSTLRNFGEKLRFMHAQ